MYTLIAPDYSLADIERFTEISVRRGIPLASLVRADPRDRRVAAGAALLFIPPGALTREQVLERFGVFLRGPGDWLAAEPEEIFEAARAEGLLELQEKGWVSRLEPLPGVTARRLADETEAAAEILKLRRARMREALQAKNREVNRLPEPSANPEEDDRFMRLALEEARLAGEAGEIPVGAVVVANGRVIGAAGNETLRTGDPTAHAEVAALRRAAAAAGTHRLADASLYVTLEPCPMCAGAIAEARCCRIIYGAADARRGAVRGALRLFDLPGVNHRPQVTEGVLAAEGEMIIKTFFARRRAEQRAQKASQNNDGE